MQMPINPKQNKSHNLHFSHTWNNKSQLHFWPNAVFPPALLWQSTAQAAFLQHSPVTHRHWNKDRGRERERCREWATLNCQGDIAVYWWDWRERFFTFLNMWTDHWSHMSVKCNLDNTTHGSYSAQHDTKMQKAHCHNNKHTRDSLTELAVISVVFLTPLH